MLKKRLAHFLPNASSQKFFYLLLAGDLAFILLHLIHKFSPWLPDSLYSLTRDGGYAEFFQYIKETWIILLLCGLTISRRKLIFASYAGLFIFFLLDDYLQIHENAGWNLANALQLHAVFGLRPQDIGELIVFGFFGVIFAAWIAIAHFASDPQTRSTSQTIFFLIILLAIFGIIFDMLEISAHQSTLGTLLAVLDDGGELLVMSIIAAFLFNHSLPKPHTG